MTEATGAPAVGALTEWFALPTGLGRVELERVITYGCRRRAIVALAHHRSRELEVRLRAEAELVVALAHRFEPAGAAAAAALTLEDVDTWPAADVDAVFARAAQLFREGTRDPDSKTGAS